MQLYPAIDIKRGLTAYGGDDPVLAAERYRADGATWIHVVDMDRAFDTGHENTGQVRRIGALDHVSMQLGGLLRTVEQVREGVEAGARRLVAGTLVLLDLELIERMKAAAGPGRLAVSIDVKRGQVMLRGASQALAETPAEVAARARDAGIGTIVYRDLERDGQLTGFDLDGGARVRSVVPDTIMAGGGASLDDILAAKKAGFTGAIVGRALHDGRFTLRDAIACSQS